MEKWIEPLKKLRLVPVIKIEDAASALPLADALSAGGLPCAEITFRTAAAADALRTIAKSRSDMLLAAGTVLTPAQADEAMDAGASLIVSPGLNPHVVEHCLAKGYPIIPGICTPSEAERAMEYGLRYLKFFPAEAAGGTAMIKAMSAPYSSLRFMPTGGITEQNLKSYLACPSVFACGGSFMVPAAALKQGSFAEIEALTRNAVALIKEENV